MTFQLPHWQKSSVLWLLPGVESKNHQQKPLKDSSDNTDQTASWCAREVKQDSFLPGGKESPSHKNMTDSGVVSECLLYSSPLRVLSDFTFTFHFPALEKEMATHSSVLAWRIPWMEEPGRLPSMGSHRVGHDWSNLAAAAAALHIQNYVKIWRGYQNRMWNVFSTLKKLCG